MLLQSDARHIPLPDESVQCIVTSPPYWGLRDYGLNGSGIGLEPTLGEYIENMRAVGRELWRVLRDDGTLWLNLGDAYCGGGRGGNPDEASYPKQATNVGSLVVSTVVPRGLKPKDLIGLAWRVAFALQADGFYLRSDIIWCLSGGTMLYARTQTGEGPATLKDLARLKPETVELWNGEKWTRVLAWHRRRGRDGATELVMRSGERIGCTDEHRWPMSRDGQRALMPTAHLVAGDVLDMTHLPETSGNGPRWVIDDAYWFAGLYLAEGSRSGDTIQISGHAKETQRWERVRIVCEHYGALPRLYVRGNTQAIHIDRAAALDAVLALLLRGRTAKDKALSPTVWELPNKALRLMVLGYLEGDGHLDGDRWRLGFTRNYRLEADLRSAAARLGASLTLKPIMVGRYPSFRGEWRWRNEMAKKDRGEIVEIRKSRAREFWDVSVADEPHLFALASGVLTHNSKPNPMPESVTDRPTRAHEYVFLLTKNARYYYDAEAVKEAAETKSHASGRKDTEQYGADAGNRKRMLGVGSDREWAADGSRNRRDVWFIATQPFNGAKLLADYVGDDGKPYRVSPDCPIHGHLPSKRTRRMGEHGEPQGLDPQNTPGSASRPDQEPGGVSASIPRPDVLSKTGCVDDCEQSPASISVSKTGASDVAETRKNLRTPHIGGTPCDTSGSPVREVVETATPHSNESRRTGLAPETSPPYTPSVETVGGTEHMSAQPALFAPGRDTDANNTLRGETGARSPGRTRNRTAGKSSRCNCTIVTVDHFATFPEKLVEPCILAGSSPKACGVCGAPRERVMQREFKAQGDVSEAKGIRGHAEEKPMDVNNHWQGTPRGTTETETLGWRPTCDHNDDTGKCLVLDPFCGSGTTGVVALKHRRRFVGIDLSRPYLKLAEERLLKAPIGLL